LGQSLEIDDKWVRNLRMNEVLIIDVINLLSLDNLTFVQKFESHILSSFFIFGHLDFTEATLINK